MKILASMLAMLLLCGIVAEGFSQTPPKREFRAAWVASVTNLDWPSSPGGSTAAQKSSLIDIFNGLQAAGINAVIFQVRPECDALYASAIEPWSYWLTGSQGTAPGPLWDPLQFAIEEAHKRGMELHAWFNPYRAERSAGNYTLAANHVVNQHPDWILHFAASSGTAALNILNPGVPGVREHVARVVADIVRRYDVDGIHADDYFYPYPPQAITSQDDSTYTSYSRGIADRGTWRRDNVNLLMKMITDSIAAIKPYVKFGMSPFGIWKNGVPPGIVGLDAYNQIYGDAIAWLQQRTVDYLTPQLYWKIGGSQDYAKLMPWWADSCFANNRHFYPGQIFGSYTAAELPNQLKLDRANPKVGGQVIFRAAMLVANQFGYADSLKKTYYTYPSLLPTMAWKDVVPPYMPRNLRYDKLSPAGTAALRWDLPITAPDGDSASRYAVYRFDHAPTLPGDLADARNMLAVVGERQYVPPTPASGGPFSYVVTALDRNYNESEPSSVLPLSVPAVPVLSSPANATTAVAESVLVIWRNSPLASSYHLQGSIDSSFTAGFFVNDSTLTDTMKTVRGYPGQATAFWRVRARNGSGTSAFSTPFSFVSGVPALASLVSPANITVDLPVVIPLKWSRATAATSYRVQLATNATFTPAVFDSAGIADTSLVTPVLEYYKIYFWRVKAKNSVGEADWTAYYRFRTVQVSGVEKESEIPTAYSLSQNYPNPFNPATVVRYQVPGMNGQSSVVSLKVYDLLGREVATLVNGPVAPGTYTVHFDGSQLTSGVYFCRMMAGEFTATTRMMLVK